MSFKKYKFIGLDSNIFSYHFHRHLIFGPVSKEIFDALSLNELRAITSIITLTEILSVKVSPAKLKNLQKLFSEIPNLTTFEISQDIALEAAKIRRKYGFRLPDAIQLATAKLSRAKAYITNDQRLRSYTGLKIVLLSEIK